MHTGRQTDSRANHARSTGVVPNCIQNSAQEIGEFFICCLEFGVSLRNDGLVVLER